MTRQQVIAKFYDDLEAAERYKEKQLDEPSLPPNAIKLTFPITSIVYLRVRDEPTRGMVTDVDLRPYGCVYHVCWGDTRCTTPHYDFELSAEPPASFT